MKAHIHVTYERHPDAYLGTHLQEKPFPLKIKVATNARINEHGEYFEDRQIFSSEKYDGPEIGILTSIFDTHIAKANGARVHRVKVECLVDEDVPSFKYYETHYELSTIWKLPEDIISWLQGQCIAYSYTAEADSVKNILTVRHNEVNNSIHLYVQDIAKIYGTEITKYYSEKVILDTNPDYDLGWAPICNYKDNKLVIA